MICLILLVVVLDNWTINVLNLYTGGLSLSNMFPRLGRFWTTLIVALVSILLSSLPAVVTRYLTFTTAIGNIFAPIAGVLIADYVFVKKTRIEVAELYRERGRYWYTNGFCIAAIAWSAVGSAIYSVLPASCIQTVSSALLSGSGYVGTIVLLRAFGKQDGSEIAGC